MRDSWFAAYDGIIAPAIIDRATAPDGGARVRQSFRMRPWQRMIAAVARQPGPTQPGRTQAETAAPDIIGYASFGPERDVLDMPWPYPLTSAGSGGKVAELYALYVHPAWWSTAAIIRCQGRIRNDCRTRAPPSGAVARSMIAGAMMPS